MVKNIFSRISVEFSKVAIRIRKLIISVIIIFMKVKRDFVSFFVFF
jgi:hypothetical protein